MNIAILTDGISPYVLGGMQKHSFNLTKYFALNGLKVTLVHFNQSDYDIEKLELFTEEEKLNIESIIIPFPNSSKILGHYLRSSYTYSVNIYNTLKERLKEFDFIIAKGFTAWKLLEEKSKGIHCPPIGVNFHGYEMYQQQTGLKSKFSALMLKKAVQPILDKADYVFSYGGKITELLQTEAKVAKPKIIEIPGGIERSWLNPKQIRLNQPRRFVFIGRYERRKGIEELHRALEQLPDNLDFEFTFIGPIPKDKQLKDKRLKYLGTIRDTEKIKNILREQDVLVCPSHSEGMPNVILEAMASGLAIIATDVGAVQLLVDKNNGFLLENNNMSSLKKALSSCIHHDITSLKEASLSKVKNFIWDSIIEQHINLISHVINNKE
jgi:glycosyltransferase involved in cell wall biosynthesis